MAKLSKNLDIRDIISKLSKNTAWLFFGVLLILCVFDALEIKKSVVLILQANVDAPPPATAREIRIDFDGYNKIVQMKQEGQTYFPTTTPTSSPFGIGQ